MPTKNNDELYKRYLERYYKSKDNGFNIEAICILYAILESELYRFLYLSGCINNKNNITIRFKKEYKEIWNLKVNQKFSLKKISVKRNYIRSLLDFAESNKDINFVQKNHEYYFIDLKDKLNNNVDFNKAKNNLDKMEKWCEKRNKIIHGLLNKEYDEFNEEIEKCAQNGLEICFELKDIVNRYSNSIDLRIKYKIQDVKKNLKK